MILYTMQITMHTFNRVCVLQRLIGAFYFQTHYQIGDETHYFVSGLGKRHQNSSLEVGSGMDVRRMPRDLNLEE